MADKKIILHPIQADGTQDTNTNLFPRTQVTNVLGSTTSGFIKSTGSDTALTVTAIAASDLPAHLVSAAASDNTLIITPSSGSNVTFSTPTIEDLTQL